MIIQALTILGIVFGVFAVAGLVSLIVNRATKRKRDLRKTQKAEVSLPQAARELAKASEKIIEKEKSKFADTTLNEKKEAKEFNHKIKNFVKCCKLAKKYSSRTMPKSIKEMYFFIQNRKRAKATIKAKEIAPELLKRIKPMAESISEEISK